MQKITTPPSESFVPAPSSLMYLQSAQENIANWANVLVELDRVPADYTDGVEDTVNHKITPGIAGYYCVVAQITYFNVVADKQYQVRIKLSNEAVFAAIGVNHVSTTEQISCIAVLPCLKMAADDFVSMYAFHEAGVGTIDIESNSNYTYLSLQRVR